MRDEFRDRFGAAFEAAAGQRGSCPDADLLARFVAGELSEDESRPVRAHIAVCGICDHVVSRLRDFDQAPPPEMPGWAATERRIWQRVAPPAPRRGAGFLRSRVLAYAGWAAMLALAYPAYVGLSGRRPAPPRVEVRPPPAVQPVSSFELNTFRSPGEPLRLGPEDRAFVLSFLVPVRPGRSYTAVIQDEAGNVVSRTALAPSDVLGNCSLLCDRRLFHAGTYRLVVPEAGVEFRFTL